MRRPAASWSVFDRRSATYTSESIAGVGIDDETGELVAVGYRRLTDRLRALSRTAEQHRIMFDVAQERGIASWRRPLRNPDVHISLLPTVSVRRGLTHHTPRGGCSQPREVGLFALPSGGVAAAPPQAASRGSTALSSSRARVDGQPALEFVLDVEPRVRAR